MRFKKILNSNSTAATPAAPMHLSCLWRALVFCLASLAAASAQAGPPSIARIWDERALASIRADTPHPPAQARNLFGLSTCMYDAWAAYDTNSVGFIYHQKHTAADVELARREAISYAAWRLLKERHVFSKTAATTLALDDAKMAELGYDTNNVSRDPSTPAGVGNLVYDAVSLWFSNDGSRQTNGTPAKPYPDYPAEQGGYGYINPPLAAALPGITDGDGHSVVDINRWQRLQIVNAVDQNGFPQGPIQPYLGAQWLGVRPFQLARTDSTQPWINPGPPPYFGGPTHTQFVKEVVAVITASSFLTPDDGVSMDISPGVYGNNSLADVKNYGTGALQIYDGHGYDKNPVTGLPYAQNLVKRGDFFRVLSEFWADGPNSETPPGHWNTVANDVSDSPLIQKRIGGTGPVVSDLEWDVKVYMAVNAAVHEAACACWGIKRYYDSWRPISAIRYLATLGQSTDPSLPSYDAKGLPLITNLIELATVASVNSGRHAGLTPGKIVVLSWPGQSAAPASGHQGVRFVEGDTWTTYQKTNFVSPAFPGYISGHSTFSRSAAEVLTAITGSKFFPGGMATYTAKADTGLVNEKGPSESVTMQWATYYDAADAAGLSRVFGGIHAPCDNVRFVGATVGKQVWEAVSKYFDGSVATAPATVALKTLPSGDGEVRVNTIRGMFYKLQSTPDLKQPMTDLNGPPVLALDSSLAVTNPITGAAKFYQAVRTQLP